MLAAVLDIDQRRGLLREKGRSSNRRVVDILAKNPHQETLMRIKLTCVVLAIGALLTIAPSHAQTYDPNYPVCIQMVEWGGTHIDCSFTSLPQCQGTASNLGWCFANPYFLHESKRPQSRAYR